MSIAASNLGPPLGRDAEIGLLASLLDGIQEGGGALVLSGEPGIGKSRLLAVAAALARERGFTVLSATGVQSARRYARARACCSAAACTRRSPRYCAPTRTGVSGIARH